MFALVSLSKIGYAQARERFQYQGQPGLARAWPGQHHAGSVTWTEQSRSNTNIYSLMSVTNKECKK
ncbi:MAG: hypothetical protein D6B25_17495 [Desulfobulbaceae bacterium]|nr:MAG: hypothetical protein D6B25_17495 [Desulfobulbaceae bacterium]